MKKIINLIIYILRYFSILKFINLSVNSKINFGSQEANNFFYKNIKKCKFYLEYGSGNSTILANKLNKKFLSIEGDKAFYNFIYQKKKIKNIKYCDLGPTKYFSIPIIPPLFLKKKIFIYANYINNLKIIPDLILIDGRFRILVTLTIIKFYSNLNKYHSTTLIIDDFYTRKNYHIIKKIIKVRLVGRFGVIKIDKNSKIDFLKLEAGIKEYFLDFM